MIELLRLADEFDKFQNLCIRTDTGEFLAKKCYLDSLTLKVPGRSEIQFITLIASFERAGVAPECWNTPVINLVSRFQPQQPIVNHPLRRLYPRNISIHGQPEKQPETADEIRRRDFCQFVFSGLPAFIDYLPSYEERKEKLRAGMSQSEVTCMMVTYRRVCNWMLTRLKLVPIRCVRTFIFGIRHIGGSWSHRDKRSRWAASLSRLYQFTFGGIRRRSRYSWRFFSWIWEAIGA
jgi:hypothetical protein